MILKVDAKEIITDEEKLGYRSDEIDCRKENKLVREITSYLNATIKENGFTSLSAPQIGYARRIFTINFNGEFHTFVNPIITQAKGFELSRETCLSIPDKTFIRPRNNDICVTYQTPLGKIQSRELVGLAAIVFQYNVDMLDGLLLSDIGLEIDEDFDNATDEERQEVIKLYLESLDIRQKQIQDETNTDEELKTMLNAVDFMTQAKQGNIQFGDKVSVTVPKEDNNDTDITTVGHDEDSDKEE